MCGLTHMLVTPKRVSGLRVAAGKMLSPDLNFTTVYSLKSGSTSPIVSCWLTGFWSRGHQPTGCEPCTIRPFLCSVLNCQEMNFEYNLSIVVNSRRQSIE